MTQSPPSVHVQPDFQGLQAVPAANDGWKMLLRKEILRFWRVAFQTIAAPVLTAVLYLMIFGHVLSDRVQVYPGVSYVAFLAPGLVMMSVLQNAFANSASSLVQSKIMGNLVFVLLTPLGGRHWFIAYVGAAIARGLLVGLGVYLVTLFYAPPQAAHPLWILAFALLGAGLMGALGMLAGLWADKFDQMATFQNFIVMPMTFLAGVFYSIHSLPGIWQTLSHFNPFFYMIDGFRYGFFGVSDVSPWLSLGVAGGSFVLVSMLTLYLLKSGYKLRS
ncbi:ABC-2 type transport system permease protein [Brachymonas denitrificans DSM 15123]|uniref:Transport permease protein n=2 Tax=Brachymonas denitrificans TaxID=28220 RepID=A0A1H8K567_9BURK|nr:ABC-2 type transport system permease protein [Brachymonas denitrificans DSM 15123]